jgi:diaminohydroxyphosphoribosylaminopyrimidine deaminase/5-amino-6-(5-phosphoribosylamino)uracil reductase
MLALATRCALRGMGRTQPNPMVGCVIGRELRDGNGATDVQILGIGHHHRFGSAHAEVNAINRAIALGHRELLRGATAWVTLEPCNHTGKTPPCARALIEAGIARVVIAREDPHDVAGGGIETLRKAGVAVDLTSACPAATGLSDPFIAWTTRHPRRPWLIAKWAQTLDGKVATASGSSQWITGPTARRRVHALRGRVDAIVTGLGSILRDDSLLTARGVPVRQVAQRVVLDAQCQLPRDAKIVATAHEVPTIVVCSHSAEQSDAARQLRAAGCVVLGCPEEPGSGGRHVALQPALELLAEERGICSAMLEAGPRLMAAAFAGGLVDEAWAFIAPKVVGDERAPGFAAWRSIDSIGDALPMRQVSARRCGDDLLVILRRAR